jgi:hypothetical protein
VKTFVIFDRKTGEILQTRTQTDDLPDSPQEVLRAARFGAKGEAADIMAVETMTPGTAYRVDVKTRKLTPVAEGKAPGAGGAFIQSSVSYPRTVRTELFNVRKK